MGNLLYMAGKTKAGTKKPEEKAQTEKAAKIAAAKNRKRNENSHLHTVRFEGKLNEWIHEQVEAGYFSNFTDCIRSCVREKMLLEQETELALQRAMASQLERKIHLQLIKSDKLDLLKSYLDFSVLDKRSSDA